MKRPYIRNDWESKQLVCASRDGKMFLVAAEGPKWKLWLQWMLAQTDSQLLGEL